MFLPQTQKFFKKMADDSPPSPSPSSSSSSSRQGFSFLSHFSKKKRTSFQSFFVFFFLDLPFDFVSFSFSFCEQTRTVGWIPPGADCSRNKNLFGQDLDYHFWIPNRLAEKSQALVEVSCFFPSLFSFSHLELYFLFFFSLLLFLFIFFLSFVFSPQIFSIFLSFLSLVVSFFSLNSIETENWLAGCE